MHDYQLVGGVLLWLMAAQPTLAISDTAPLSPGPKDAPPESGTTSPLTLQRAVQMALERNPGLAGARARAKSLETVPSQEGALPDPRLGIGALNLPTDTFAFDQEPMTQVELSLNQTLPFPGKLSLRRGAAEQEAKAAAAGVDERRLGLVGEVRAAWWKLFYLQQSLAIVARNQDLMRQFVEIAQTKYAVGKGLQQDVLLASLELSRLLDRELELRNERQRAEASVNALLDRPAGTLLELPAQTPAQALPSLAAEAELVELAETNRPALAIERRLLKAAKARVALAEREYYPDFDLGVGYAFRQGSDPGVSQQRPDMLSVMVSVNLPLYLKGKQSKQVDQRTSELFERKAMLQQTRRSVQSAIAQHLADYQRARQQVMLFKTGIIPQARQTVASMLAGYRVGEVDFLNLVNAEITLYNYEISYWQALSEAKQSLAQIAAAVGLETLYE